MFAGAGSVKSSAGTYTAWKLVTEPFVRGGDALLEIAHLGGERRLITDRRRRAPEQRAHLRARLREAENVVDEKEHVLVLLVAEILRHRERRQAPRARRAPGGSFIWPYTSATFDLLKGLPG